MESGVRSSRHVKVAAGKVAIPADLCPNLLMQQTSHGLKDIIQENNLNDMYRGEGVAVDEEKCFDSG